MLGLYHFQNDNYSQAQRYCKKCVELEGEFDDEGYSREECVIALMWMYEELGGGLDEFDENELNEIFHQTVNWANEKEHYKNVFEMLRIAFQCSVQDGDFESAGKHFTSAAIFAMAVEEAVVTLMLDLYSLIGQYVDNGQVEVAQNLYNEVAVQFHEPEHEIELSKVSARFLDPIGHFWEQGEKFEFGEFISNALLAKKVGD